MPDLKFKRLYQVWKGNNRFLCGGRCIFGPDVVSLLLSTLLITAPIITLCYQISVKIQKYEKLHEEDGIQNHHHVLRLPVLVVTIIIMLADFSFLLLTSSRDPGIVPRNAQPLESSDTSDVNTPSIEWINGRTPHLRLPRTKDVIINGFAVKVKYCDTCLLYRPPRTSHCSICNNCVQKFDHHCPWVGQCIGLRNYRFFFLFLSTSTFLCIYVFTLSVMNIIQERKNYHNSFTKLIVGEIISAVLIVYTFLSVWFVGGLTIFHLYLISTNQTTYENFRYRYDKKDNPFTKGIVKNFKEVFFSRIAPSMINFRTWVLDEAIGNGSHLLHMGMDVFSTSEKADVETSAALEIGGNMPIPSILQNLDYSSINEKQRVIDEHESEAPDPLALANIQENVCQGLREDKQSCKEQEGTSADSKYEIDGDETVLGSVADEDAHVKPT